MAGSGNSSLTRSTSFKRGARKPKNSGRVKGTRNKTTLLLKEATVLAAEACGEDGNGKNGLIGFLTALARQQPKAFGRLLEKILPMQPRGELQTVGLFTAEQAAERAKESGLPVPPFQET